MSFVSNKEEEWLVNESHNRLIALKNNTPTFISGLFDWDNKQWSSFGENSGTVPDVIPFIALDQKKYNGTITDANSRAAYDIIVANFSDFIKNLLERCCNDLGYNFVGNRTFGQGNMSDEQIMNVIKKAKEKIIYFFDHDFYMGANIDGDIVDYRSVPDDKPSEHIWWLSDYVCTVTWSFGSLQTGTSSTSHYGNSINIDLLVWYTTYYTNPWYYTIHPIFYMTGPQVATNQSITHCFYSNIDGYRSPREVSEIESATGDFSKGSVQISFTLDNYRSPDLLRSEIEYGARIRSWYATITYTLGIVHKTYYAADIGWAFPQYPEVIDFPLGTSTYDVWRPSIFEIINPPRYLTTRKYTSSYDVEQHPIIYCFRDSRIKDNSSGILGQTKTTQFLLAINMNSYYDDTNPSRDIDDGESGTGGGGGNFDKTSDPIPLPALPTDTTLSGNLVSLYKVDAAQLRQLSDYLYNTSSSLYDVIDELKKIYNNPLDFINAVYTVPFLVEGDAENIYFGHQDSGVSAIRVKERYITLSAGSYKMAEYFGNALDYDPYTKVDLYIPFYGHISLSTDEVMGSEISVKYQVDCATGTGIAYVLINGNALYSYNVNMYGTLPLTEISKSGLLSTIGSAMGLVGSVATGNVGGVVSNSLGMVSSSKPTVEHGGGLTSNVGMMGIFYPYLIIHRPITSLPANYKGFKGYPSNITYTLSDLSGYTEIDSIHLDDVICTEDERTELESLLSGGIIL